MALNVFVLYSSKVGGWPTPRIPPEQVWGDPGLSGGKLIFSPPEPKSLCSGDFRGEFNFCQSPQNWCLFWGGLIFGPSLNSSLNKIVQGKLFLWSPWTNFYFVLGEMNFQFPKQNFWMLASFQREKARKPINLSHQTRGYLGPAEISIIFQKL